VQVSLIHCHKPYVCRPGQDLRNLNSLQKNKYLSISISIYLSIYLYIYIYLYILFFKIYMYICPQKSGVPAPIKHIGFKRCARLYLEKLNLMRAKCII
jgi:hypothetical protein